MIRAARMLVRVIITVLCFGFYATLAWTQESMPEEVRENYPEESFIVRSGSGETPEAAADNARFEIVKYFESNISGETFVNEWAKSRSKRGKTTEERFTAVTNTILIGASRELPGVDIVSESYDKKRNTYNAWAALDKRKHMSYLSEKILSLDNGINQTLSTLSDDDLSHLRILSQIMQNLLLREEARRDLMLLEIGPVAPSRESDLQRVMSGLDSLIADAFDVGLIFENDMDGAIRSGIVKGITDAGIRVKEYPGKYTAIDEGNDLLLTVENNVNNHVRSKTFNNKEFTFYFVNWALNLKAIDPATEEVISTWIGKGETNGSFEDQAFERMTSKILETQVPEMSNWVYEAIFKPEQ